MTTSVAQVRLPTGLLKEVDKLVDKGMYTNRSEFMRESIRKSLGISSLIGIIPNKGDSVKQIRAIRKKLSKEPIDLDEINSLNNLVK